MQALDGERLDDKRIGGDGIELWGGLECSIVAVGDDVRDQIAETGHKDRPRDIELLAEMGFRTVRYPVLWEAISPDHPDTCDWRWQDARLGQLRSLDIKPVAGLIHHGSGPCYADLTSEAFPRLLAAHAARVAERYPWIENYTPVNEPLTTARFSALYGHWRPHKKDDASFLRALVNQCSAVALSMEAIRAINPNAKLVQTEDLGKTFATPMLQYQADYENERRWLSLDLLCGRVDRHHPWWMILTQNGIDERELIAFLERPCIPDVLGVNHYLTSERYLDERHALYPEHLRGGNGHHAYADAEAVRIAALDGETGLAARLREAWTRYQRPIAVTEAHHGCSRDEQLRWLLQVWEDAHAVAREGVDMRAVTIWSLFGAYDWNSLLTRKVGHYEPGAFDVRSSPPRPTVLASAAQRLARGEGFDHPVLDAPGWWKRHGRFYEAHGPKVVTRRADARRLLITGGTGTLGRAIARLCDLRGLAYVLPSRLDMDIADAASVERALAAFRPWAVINAAGYVRVSRAHLEKERCIRENVDGAQTLAHACAALGVPFVTFSSDLVFDGRLGRPYRETDLTSPLCVYGRSKAEAERRVLRAFPHALIVRTSAFFGPWDQYNFAWRVLTELQDGKTFQASDTEQVTPTYVPDLAHTMLDLLIDGEHGVWHLANDCAISWHDFAVRLADQARLPRRLVARASSQRRNTGLSSARGRVMPALDHAIDRFFSDAVAAGGHR